MCLFAETKIFDMINEKENTLKLQKDLEKSLHLGDTWLPIYHSEKC